MANRAVFLDRDQTIIEDPGYISDPAAVKLLPGVDLAIKSLRQGGYLTVVVTNQSGIARGLLTEEALEKIHGEMRRQLAAGGAHLDAVYYCPFHPEGTVEPYAVDSDLRKPSPGMLLKAAGDLDIDLSASWMVGDGARDIEAGQRAGCRTIRVRAAAPAVSAEAEDENVQSDFTVRNLLEAAKLILHAPARVHARPGGAASPPRAAEGTPPPSPGGEAGLGEREILLEILRQVRELSRKLGQGGPGNSNQ
jgi:D-glycero-D-manno-heptose 1,7-bisphosphate phosphatase